jgi:hypothetical protein
MTCFSISHETCYKSNMIYVASVSQMHTSSLRVFSEFCVAKSFWYVLLNARHAAQRLAGLVIRIMCASESTCLAADCCLSELAL